MKQRRSLFFLLALVALIIAVWSYMLFVAPQPRSLNQQVDDVAAQLKCPVCQNESVDSSSASISEEMRLVIRQQLQSGKSEQQVLDYFAAHYGNQILLTPPTQGINLLAWLVPAGTLALGLGLVVLAVRDWRADHPQPPEKMTRTYEDILIDPELEQYRAQLEKELAEDDDALLFG